MIERLEKAIEMVKRLPNDRQALAAIVLEEIAAGDVFAVPEEHRSGVLEGLAQIRRGERVSEADMQALWKKCGL